VRMEMNEVDLNYLISDVSELYKRDDREIGFHFDLNNDLPLITADARGLRQVLNNLLINAQDALVNTKDPVIMLSTRSVQSGTNNYIELTVQDNGPGIAEDLLAKLFEPYVTTKEKGTGLGLAIVKRIVEEHGGAIWVESRPGEGAKITVRLPVSNLRADGMADIRLAAARAAGERR